MTNYQAYGFSIASEIALPLTPLPVLDAEPDIVIRCGKVKKKSNVVVREVEDLFGFSISYAGEIVVDVYDQGKTKLIASILRGEVISAYLRWQGYVVLHASAVYIPPRAIGFMGISGSGKSTTALSCLKYKENAKIITDDILPLRIFRNKVCATPSFPKARLWEEVREKVWNRNEYTSGMQEEFIHEKSEKKELSIDNHFSKEICNLDSIFILNGYSDNNKVIIESVSKVDALKFIMSQVWSRGIVGDSKYEAQDLHNVGRLVNSVDIFKISRSRNINNIKSMIDSVLEKRGIPKKS